MKKIFSFFAVFVCTVLFLLIVPKAYAINPELAGIAIEVKDPAGIHITGATVTVTLNGNSPGTHCTIPGAKSTDSHKATETTGFYALDDVCCTVSGFSVVASAPNYNTVEVFVDNPWLTGTGRSTLLVNDGNYYPGTTITLTPNVVYTCANTAAEHCQQEATNNKCLSGWSPASGKTCQSPAVCCRENLPTCANTATEHCQQEATQTKCANGWTPAQTGKTCTVPAVCCVKTAVVSTPAPTKVPCEGTCSDPTQCTDACPVCSANNTCTTGSVPTPTSTPAPTPTPRPVCADPCPNDTRCRGAANGCTSCLPKSITDRTNVCSPIPVCGKECVDTRDCRGARGGCTLCQTNTSGKKVCSPAPTSTPTPTRAPTPTPTPPLSCNSPCTTPASCTGAINGCTFCSPTTNKCEVPPACNSDCSANPNICQQATGGCNFCNPATNRCTVPNTPTPSPTPFPFDDSMCACDGLTFTKPTLGDTMTVNAFGKVLGVNSNFAKIPTITFSLFQGSETRATKIKSETINTTILSETAQATRYQALWKLALPSTLDKTKTYRIQAKPNCARKTAAVFSTNKNSVVLGSESPNQKNLLVRLFEFIAGLVKSIDQNQSRIADTTEKDSLQLETFTPAKNVETGRDSKNCSFVKFSF